MPVIGPSGERLPGRLPPRPPADDDLLDALVASGPLSFTFAPCSGNCWSREFLEAVLPMPEQPFRRGADGFLLQLSPIYGNACVIDAPLSAYRRHGANFLASKSEFEIRDLLRERYPALSESVANHLVRRGIEFDRNSWKHQHWERLDELEAAISKHISQGESFVLIDGGLLNVGDNIRGRRTHTIPPDDERDAGPQQVGERIINQLQIYRDRGIRFVVVMWYSFWWFKVYPGVDAFMRANALQIQQSSTSWIYEFVPNLGPAWTAEA
jgi:hypothetical protein